MQALRSARDFIDAGEILSVSEVEVVRGQHGRNALIQKIEGERSSARYKVRCREQGRTCAGIAYMDVRITAWRTSYLSAYDAAEAWAWRGERPEGDES